MIEGMQIRDEACFDSTGQSLDELKAVNFLYGANASGKTTVSRIMANEDGYSQCGIDWSGGNRLEVHAYNKDFVEKNFNADSELHGIFTLGEKDEAVIQAITTAKEQLVEIDKDIAGKRKTLSGENGDAGKMADLKKLHGEFEDICWESKTRYDGYFKEAFAGVRDKKSKFKQKIELEAKNRSAELCGLEDLKNQASTVFSSELRKELVIPPFLYDDLIGLESSSILMKTVVGKDDVDIAEMIKRLGNSDWVKEGLQYLEESSPNCPFCQQSTESAFAESLNEYFDESYTQDLNDIEQLKTNYDAYSTATSQRLQSIIDASPMFIDVEALKTQKDLIETRISANMRHIDRKKKEPSTSIVLEPLGEGLDEIAASISDANNKISAHNNTVDNIEVERSDLRAKIWRFVVDDAKASYENFEEDRRNLETAIAGLEEAIDAKEKQKSAKENELQKLEQNITSIQPTIDSINKLLKSFGFYGFSLANSEKEGFYEIVRPGGDSAQGTLSEGERTFLTFLYFYHLLQGSVSESGITSDRIVVFDDPISSLDSDILFIVSSLIKGLIEKLRANTGYIRQIFVLTHNIYFHREVTFNKRRSADKVMKDETFWIVRKTEECSTIEKHETNPIKTSYELLWHEVRDPSRSPLTIQNALRRIIENYFKIFGNINFDDIVDMFDGEEKLICGSLFSWINAGSHYVDDDLFVACDDQSVAKFLGVFRRIFEVSGHPAHYNMMMGTSEDG